MVIFRPFGLGLLLLFPLPALLACSCVGGGPPCQSIGRGTTIFTGKVTASRQELRSETYGLVQQRRVTFELLEMFRGTPAPKLELVTGIGGGDCGYPFAVGATYLVYAYQTGEPAALGTGICSRTAPIDRAAEDLAFLRSLSSLGPEGSVTGHVYGVLPLKRGEAPKGLAGVTVWLESADGKIKTATDSEGNYEFTGLSPNDYLLSVAMPGKLGGGAVRKLPLAPQTCSVQTFFAQELGEISGVIRDASGQPAKQVWVEILRASDRQPAAVEKALTGDDGSYSLRGVPPGTYLIGVHLNEAPRGTKFLWMPYERSYYPGVKDAGHAQAVAVESAGKVENMDWKLGPPLTRRLITGTVLGPDGKPAVAVAVSLRVEGYEDNADLAVTRPGGAFSLEALSGLRYFVQASSGRRQGSEAWHCHAIAVPGGSEPLVVKLDRPGKDCDQCRKQK